MIYGMFNNSLSSNLFFSVTIWLLCRLSSPHCCNSIGMMILLHFIAILPMVVISYLNDHYGCSPFCPSIDGQVWSVISEIACLGAGHLVVPFLFHLLSYSLVCMYITALHWWLCTYLVFLCLCWTHVVFGWPICNAYLQPKVTLYSYDV